MRSCFFNLCSAAFYIMSTSLIWSLIFKRGPLLNLNRSWSVFNQLVHFSTSSSYQAGGKWRESHGLPSNHNQFGPLTDLPDWSYLDGRPTPIGGGQRKRMESNIDIGKQILNGLEDIERAEKMYEARINNNKKRRQDILNGKLKKKGNHLNNKS
ncbi:large ribosomal subunit protein mL52-like [Tubulanus polymorphus]|uniref:large ribosomal subunit protein mL52-like n=1 Tax=Tubulanus polymorphus TaxID=672921 RepID=UPI003DA57CCE